ncbi:YXWGXW repeat-containing protein [candidate division KSB1 bacterium]|nr:YXWGXW repeat-containing protein [candidate division KSB1 bacterium]
MRSKTIAAFAVMFTMALPGFLLAGPHVYVKVNPPSRKVVVVKPEKPHHDSIWINGAWRWTGHKYVWNNGYWPAPRKGFVWISGHWAKAPKGWHWIEGHWKRV